MKRLLLAILCAGPALAGESDGGHAHPERWTHPHGPASGTGRSLARPPASFGGSLWKYRAKQEIVAPPVTWDGAVFVLDGPTLLALDAVNGQVLAHTGVSSAEPRPAVYNRAVFLLEGGSRLAEYRLEGRKLSKEWSYDVGAGASAPRILQGEIFFTGSQGLVRLREGRRKPVWTVAGRYTGEPAVFGDHVYALRRDEGALVLVAHDRNDGRAVANAEVSSGIPDVDGARVSVSEDMAAVKIGKAAWAILDRKEKDGTPSLEFLRKADLLTDPLVSRVVLALEAKEKGSAWTIFAKGKRPVFSFATNRERPDLVLGAASPVLLQHTLCFGNWAGDINSNEIYWRLDERRDVRDFAKGVAYAAVPANHERLLVVTRDKKELHLVGPERIG